MPRRASSGANPLTIIIVLLVLAAVGYALKAFIGGGKDEAFADTPELSISDFQENANSLRGNTYRIDGTVDEKLRFDPDKGQVLSVFVEQTGESGFLVVELPADADFGNVEVRQNYRFQLEFRNGGIATVSGLQAL